MPQGPGMATCVATPYLSMTCEFIHSTVRGGLGGQPLKWDHLSGKNTYTFATSSLKSWSAFLILRIAASVKDDCDFSSELGPLFLARKQRAGGKQSECVYDLGSFEIAAAENSGEHGQA